jgi:hypothetical protein
MNTEPFEVTTWGAVNKGIFSYAMGSWACAESVADRPAPRRRMADLSGDTRAYGVVCPVQKAQQPEQLGTTMKRILIASTLAAALSACAPRWEPSQTPFLTPEMQKSVDAANQAQEAAMQTMMRKQQEDQDRQEEERDAAILAAQKRERDARQALANLCKVEFVSVKSVISQCVNEAETMPSAQVGIALKVHLAAVERKQAHAELDRYVKTCGQNCSSLTMTDLVDAAAKADMKWNEIGQR